MISLSRKKTKSCLTLAAIFCSLAAMPANCQEAPESIVQNYFRALSTAKTQAELDPFESKRYRGKQNDLLNSIMPARRNKFMDYLRTGMPKTIKVGSIKIDGEKAKIDVQAAGNLPMQPSPPGKDPSVQIVLQTFGTFFLNREDGKWKIDAECWESDKSQCPSVNPNDWLSWVKEAVKTDYPQTKAQGKLDGATFLPDTCIIGPHPMFGGTWLQFLKEGKGITDGISINLLDEPGNVEEKVFEVSDDKLSWTKKKMFNIIRDSDKYPGGSRTSAGVGICAMKLKFDRATAAGIPGNIVLRLTGQPETSIAGAFTARKK